MQLSIRNLHRLRLTSFSPKPFLMRQLNTLFSLIFIVIVSLLSNYAHGQATIKKMTLKISLVDMKGAVTNSYLHSASDSGLFLCPASTHVYANVDPQTLTFFDANQINLVTMRKKNQVSKGFARGALVGGVVGALAGVAGSGGGGDGGFILGTGGTALFAGVGGAALGGILGMAFSPRLEQIRNSRR